MKAEQRQAVLAALTRPLTVITGPSGTGKSQIVTNIIAEAMCTGQRVLFASKDDKAVDVVEARINGLTSRSSLLRLGQRSYLPKLAESIEMLLAPTATAADERSLREAVSELDAIARRRAALVRQRERLVCLENEAGALARESEAWRRILGDRLFREAEGLDAAPISEAIDEIFLRRW
ncbi:MAG: AAA family ATPase [Elioraea sp.]|nr:AAA family ATPase [Elioraea sp.]